MADRFFFDQATRSQQQWLIDDEGSAQNQWLKDNEALLSV